MKLLSFKIRLVIVVFLIFIFGALFLMFKFGHFTSDDKAIMQMTEMINGKKKSFDAFLNGPLQYDSLSVEYDHKNNRLYFTNHFTDGNEVFKIPDCDYSTCPELLDYAEDLKLRSAFNCGSGKYFEFFNARSNSCLKLYVVFGTYNPNAGCLTNVTNVTTVTDNIFVLCVDI
ncbi:MAG: hypothetical protein AB7G44_06150 [Bacteroidia bacterium]